MSGIGISRLKNYNILYSAQKKCASIIKSAFLELVNTVEGYISSV